MIKRISTVRRRPDLSPDEFAAYWLGPHAEIAREMPGALGYVVNIAQDPEEAVVTVIDGSSHALAWIGSALGVPCVPLGVDRFGQAGSQPSVYAEYGINADAIATAALVALES